MLQLCHYAEQLTAVQGVAPELIHVVLGGRGGRVSLRLNDFAAYYRAAKARFEAAVLNEDTTTYPEPVEHCRVCSWREACDGRRIADDHLCLVAGLGRDQARKLATRAGITTVVALAGSSQAPVLGMGAATVDRLRQQARLQVEARDHYGPPPWELLECGGPGIGLGGLPPPAPGDLFFDIEGDPFVGDVGLEYLFGLWGDGPDGQPVYQAFWGHDAEGERVGFEALVDHLVERRAEYPNMHVYHYAPYEPAALGKLMGRYATREEEIDSFLRGGLLVDLYQVVRQGVRVGTPSYSLKKLEGLYMEARTGAVTDAGSSIAEYERWLEEGEQSILDDIAAYNRDDCRSTAGLRNWLEDRRADYAAAFGEEPPRPIAQSGEAPPGRAEEVSRTSELLAALEAAPVSSDEERDVVRLTGALLGWHQREDKPEWWMWFHRVLDCTEDDLYADSEAIAGLEYVGIVGEIKRSDVHRYRFDPAQEYKIGVGADVRDPAEERRRLETGARVSAAGTVVALDQADGTIDLKRGKGSLAPHPRCVISGTPISTSAQRDALRRLATAIAVGGVDGDGPYRAVRDLLLRRPPRLNESEQPLVGDSERPTDAVPRLALSLSGGCLAVQGPPGSGKTHTAAATVVVLVAAGRRVGVTANSHSVITNLLDAVLRAGAEAGVPVRCMQKGDEDQVFEHPDVRRAAENAAVDAALDANEVDVVAGTAWLFARPEMDSRLDVLVVDEAGQLSLANVAAVGTAAHNLILVGDPRQLAQPSQGTHPPGAEASGLGHLLGEAAVIAPDRGVFLDHSRRLHPDICRFISEVVYAGRLASLDECVNQRVGGSGALAGSGLRWRPVAHVDNRVSSEEEAAAVAEIVGSLLGRPWFDRAGRERVVGLDDILVVAPYNAQVSLVTHSLPAGARVGTVDKFQGQEAAVAIVSMAASSAEDVPRGMEFLYSRNRLNVAVSRAQALAVMVASPTLLSVNCRTVDQMRLANGLCRYVEMAVELPA